MKKILAILALAVTGTAFATEGVNFEFERERGINSPNTMENTIKVAPFVKLDNGVKFDIQFGASRNDGTVSGNNNPIEGSIEARVQKLWEVYPGLKLGGRVSVGEKFNGDNKAGNTTDFSYYTIEPKAEYAVTERLSALTSWRYRDAFSDSVAYQTRTWKIGAGYAVTKQDVIETKYFMKRGDSNTNGIELAYTRSF
jgi:opacity protein-like surface antigen